ncbi:MAG: hypothetical protein A3A51_00615 [Candidatus Levybacteria bacterium RIFCSPLOWO2_01_FULL_39_10]|nr:MAG: hypothetical protein A3A51_00615 [Candidatus Levybacteria bacterium RIFCSPLOWO2_01_FULL_39_10]
MKKIFFFASIIVGVIIINSLVRSIYNLLQKEELVSGAMMELEAEKRLNKELKERLSYVKSDQFIEEEARNKLFLVKEGESEVLIPKILIATASPTPTPIPPNWRQWINLIMGN